MTYHANGRCSVCQATGEPDHAKVLLCEDCVHPDEIRSYCLGCGARRSYAPESLAALLSAHALNREVSPGTVMRLERCGVAQCIASTPGLQIEFFAIAA